MKTEAEKQLAKLVSMPTLSDNIAANDIALDYIQRYLAERGMFVERFRLNNHGALVASTRTDNAKNPVALLAGHIDVVPGGKHLFTMRTEDDKLIGRGVFDMKFAAAGYMQLVDDLQDRLEDYDFAIMITTDEEYGGRTGTNGSRSLVEAGYRAAKTCILPDSAAAGWNIEERAKAPWRFQLKAAGRAAHGSRPWEGESASFKLIHALHDLKEYFKDHGPATNTLNIGLINGGEAFNQIPAQMTAGIEIRILSLAAYDKLLKVVKDICARHKVEYEELIVTKPLETDLTHPMIASYIDTVESITGRRPQPTTSFAASDAPYFTAAGIPCIVSCPQGGGHHSEEEWIDRAEFAQFVPILKDYLTKHALVSEVASRGFVVAA